MTDSKEYFYGRSVDEDDKKHERAYWRRIGVEVVAILIAAFLLGSALYAGKVYAAEVFKAEGQDGSPIAYRLTDKPCTNKGVLKYLYGRVMDDRRFKAGILTWKGKNYESCWIDVDGYVHSWDSTGEKFQPVPRGMFKESTI